MVADQTMGDSLEGLLGHLERSSAAARLAEASLRAPVGPRIPHMQDRWVPEWRPPPDKDEVKKHITGDCTKTFVRFTKNVGTEFEAPGYMKPKHLDTWTAKRVVMPDRSFAKLRSQINYRAQSEAIPEPLDGLCNEMHQRWLRRHYAQRDRHVHEVYHALERVHRAEDSLNEIRRKRELTRDLLSRKSVSMPNLGEKAVSSLARVRQAVQTVRNFRTTQAVDPLAEEESKAKAKLAHAKSASCLLFRPPTPDGQVKHLRSWAGPDKPLRYLRESTPWREQDEVRELASGARRRNVNS